MGLKESGLRGSLRNVSVGIDAILDSVVDNFETGDITRYSGDTGDFSVSESNVVEGTFALEGDAPSGGAAVVSDDPVDGEDFKKGRIVSFLAYDPDSGGDGREPTFLFGWEGLDVDNDGGYGLFIGTGNEFMQLQRHDDGYEDINATVLDEDEDVTDVGDEWVEVEIEWHDGTGEEPDNTIKCTAYEIDQSTLERQSEIGSVSAQDSTYQNETNFGWATRTSASSETILDAAILQGEV